MEKISFALLLGLLYLNSCAQMKSTPENVNDSSFLFKNCLSDEESSKIFTNLEVLPEFPGGHRKWLDFIKANFDFNSIEKTLPDSILIYDDSIIVKFVVSKRGKLCGFSFLSEQTNAVKNAVVLLFQKSPNWKPGTNGGRLLNAYRTLKIRIRYTKNSNRWELM